MKDAVSQITDFYLNATTWVNLIANESTQMINCLATINQIPIDSIKEFNQRVMAYIETNTFDDYVLGMITRDYKLKVEQLIQQTKKKQTKKEELKLLMAQYEVYLSN